jgi:hypothetical protein
MPELTPEPDSTGGENQKKKSYEICMYHWSNKTITLGIMSHITLGNNQYIYR